MADAPANIDQSSQNNRMRRYLWRLGFTLVVLLVASGLLLVMRGQQQIVLIERIESTEGHVVTEPVGPKWLRNLLNEQRMLGFDNVIYVSVNSSLVTDQWLEDITRLRSLNTLLLYDTKISDDGLLHLQEITGLEYLLLANANVSDAGLVHLKGLTGLKRLTLTNTRVSKAGVKELQAALPDCEISH